MKNVFPTEQEAIDAQAVDWAMYYGDKPCECFDACEHDACFNQGNTCGGYWRTTKRCDNIQKREDAEEWFYEVFSVGVQTHTQKEAQASWYPAMEV